MQLAPVSEGALADANAKIIVIGCGDWQPIKTYLGIIIHTFIFIEYSVRSITELTDFKGELYSDPSRSLFRALGMTLETLDMTPSGAQKKSYLKRGYTSNVLKSVWVCRSHATLADMSLMPQ